MLRFRLWLGALLCLALFVLGGPRLLASQRALAEIDVGGSAVLTAGERVEVRWTALPQGTDEFELLLICDLPRPLTLRLTECEDPSVPGMAWRVPNVPCVSARLVLRRGEAGREIIWGQSEPFRIVWSSAEAPERAELQEGELWLRSAKHKPRPVEEASDLWREGGLGRLPGAVRISSSSWFDPPNVTVRRRAGKGGERAGRDRRVRLREPVLLQLRI